MPRWVHSPTPAASSPTPAAPLPHSGVLTHRERPTPADPIALFPIPVRSKQAPDPPLPRPAASPYPVASPLLQPTTGRLVIMDLSGLRLLRVMLDVVANRSSRSSRLLTAPCCNRYLLVLH
ncbi:hypothetical protein SETIT_9G459900v2 [Setaria italica]|uniref:Uncharacterized protein n=2 Tax=Setaria TaxID=4554 RepID=A0A368ST00_SETIT|nr:hypothetical protein SETIT_9G459900v2 [Setaria italica]TKV96940.1 hypothetical protein SEVIR_9G463250v2 [Setaria viridis]